MVLGVCRRILGDPHEAEDAFQATFLVLARKAVAVARCRSAGAWLYTVAYRVALRARARRAARSAREHPLEEPPRSSVEVARVLGCPVGTAESWLTRARARLRSGLTRRGLAPAPGLLAGLVPREAWLLPAAARAALAAARGTASVEAAALAGEVLRTLAVARVKNAVAVLLLAAAAATAFGLAMQKPPRAEAPAPPAPQTVQPDEKQTDEPALGVELTKPRPLKAPGTNGSNSLAFSPVGRRLASAGENGRICLWQDWQDGQAPMSLEHPGTGRQPVASHWVCFSPDGKTLASAAKLAPSLTAEGKVKIGESVIGEVRLWDAESGQPTGVLRSPYPVESVAFSPDGKVVAVGTAIRPGNYTSLKNLKDPLPSEEELRREMGGVYLWNPSARETRTVFRSDTVGIHSVSFSPDGKTLAFGGTDGGVRLWDVVADKERACLRDHPRRVSIVCFSPDGKTLATAPYEPTDPVTLWDVPSGQVRGRLPAAAGNRVKGLAFSPDGTLAVACAVWSRDDRQQYVVSGEVQLWDAATLKLRCPPRAVPHIGEAVAFGDCGKILAVGGGRAPPGYGGGPGEVTLWELTPGGGTR
jgi:WD40 repeat protein